MASSINHFCRIFQLEPHFSVESYLQSEKYVITFLATYVGNHKKKRYPKYVVRVYKILMFFSTL